MNKPKFDWIDFTLAAFVAIYNLGILFIALLWLFTNVFEGYKGSLGNVADLEINEKVTYSLFLAGALGGAFYCLRALYQRIGDTFTPHNVDPNSLARGLNIKPWFFWYLYRPIQGGVLALILLSLVNANLITTKQFTAESIKSYFVLIAIGFISGFGSHELIHKIQELIQVLFAKSKIGSSNAEAKNKENNNN